MPKWAGKSWLERTRQSREAKQEMRQRLRDLIHVSQEPEPWRPGDWTHIRMPINYYTDAEWSSTSVDVADSTSAINWRWPSYETTATAAQWQETWVEAMWRRASVRDRVWVIDSWGGGTDPIPLSSPISQEEADRRLAATRAAAHKTAIRRQRAVKKGRKLLLEVLTEAQKQEYARTKAFTVIGANGRIYKLRKGGTTHELDESGLPILSHCIHLPYSYIDEDTLVAVKMLLETDPKKFLEIANTTRLVRSPIGMTVPSIPQEMEDRATALRGGADAINERFQQLSVAAAQARGEAQRLGRAFELAGEVLRESVNVAQSRIQNAHDYGDYARELEHQVVLETVGPVVLPDAVRHQHVARTLGHAEDIAGVPVAA